MDDDEKMILYTGRLADNKGLEHLVDASYDVVARYPEAKFVIVGEDWGVLKRLKKKIWANNLDDYFEFTGHIDSYELFKSGYAAANVFVLPSEWEAFGIVLLEAMACGTPIVASDVGGIPDVVGDIGRIFKYGDTRALAENIIDILDNEEQEREKSIQGRAKVIEQFTWSAVVDRLEAIYGSLVDSM
jgi:glycosyltransferase involved in cell wall biosynthesis